ncbi:MAG TPA: bifunctional demethylmenaquinone methyltransferase/2-methoxy-6-polyprenyl-1,4-benzoquinol methylase UbiE [Tepidisphaeraceae bacterium]|nr:bifunctional demethylmenaquinone methyltransferase/2-methoxy-6-polyprenyl-1,4-benzoquinol methylase UbiE [Tepidisphaeraceae bacterium]
MVSTETIAPAPQPAWDDRLLRDPHAVADKRARVRRMFAAIAPSYDLNNRLHSLWMDQHWRRKAVTLAALKPTDRVVDVACGTGDLTLAFADHLVWRDQASNPVGRVVGIDFTYEMLPIAREKWDFHGLFYQRPNDPGVHPSVHPAVQWINGDAQSLPLADQSADVVSIAFGIRNVADPAAALREFHRVLRPGGRVIVLEFSLPTNPVLRGLYNFYFRKVLPRTATLVSGDRTGAYKYLPESVNTFIGREQMAGMMKAAGFTQVEQFPLTFGVCVCYRGVKA